MKAIKVILATIMSLISSSALSTGNSKYYAKDYVTINRAFDIVKGRIVDGSLEEHHSKNSCFSHSFNLHVTEAYKGNMGNQIVLVGLNVKTFTPKPDSNYLFLLKEASSEFIKYCEVDQPNKFKDFYVTFGYVIAVFEVEGSAIYATKCDVTKPILHEKMFTQESLSQNGCVKYKGKYQELEEFLNKKLKN